MCVNTIDMNSVQSKRFSQNLNPYASFEHYEIILLKATGTPL